MPGEEGEPNLSKYYPVPNEASLNDLPDITLKNVSLAMILLGLAILLGSLIMFLFPIVFAILMELIFIPFEEENLERIFGEKYFDYKKRTRRWI